MTRLRAAAALPLVLILAIASPTSAAPRRGPPVAIVFLVDGVSFEQLMAVPEVRALARAGGAALMSPRTVSGDLGPGRELTLGTGARSAGPDPRPNVAGSRSVFVLREFDRYVAVNRTRSTPGLLGSLLQAHGITPCVIGKPPGPAVLVAMDMNGRASNGPRTTSCRFAVIEVGHPSAASGGLSAFGRTIRPLLEDELRNTRRLQVILVAPAASSLMRAEGDELTPVVVAEGGGSTLFPSAGALHTLSSDTTRRTGVVSNEDVAPTILHFFHVPVPSEMNGSPIRVVDAPPPFALHRKHLEARRMWIPLQIGALVAVVVMGSCALFAVSRRRRLGPLSRRGALLLPLSVAPLATVLLAAASLPTLSYATVIPTLVFGTLAGGLLGLAFLRRGPLVPAAAVGAGVIGFFVAEAFRGWPDTMFTFIGGTALDGARFYGLPNNDIGLLAGCGLWVAASLAPFTGFVVLIGLALFAGFPDLGANVGGAITLFAAAGLWLMIRTRPRFRLKELGFTAALVAVGTLAVLAANRYLAATPTHATRFVETGGGHGGIVHTVTSRLGTGVHLLLQAPLAFIPVLSLPVLLWLTLRPPNAIRPSFDRHPEWRTAMVVLVLAGIVAYVANDTGAAAAGFGFGLATAGLFYLPLAESARGDPAEEPQPVARRPSGAEPVPGPA